MRADRSLKCLAVMGRGMTNQYLAGEGSKAGLFFLAVFFFFFFVVVVIFL